MEECLTSRPLGSTCNRTNVQSLIKKQLIYILIVYKKLFHKINLKMNKNCMLCLSSREQWELLIIRNIWLIFQLIIGIMRNILLCLINMLMILKWSWLKWMISYLLSNIHILIYFRLCEDLLNFVVNDLKSNLNNKKYKANNLDKFYSDYNEFLNIYKLKSQGT